jgi:type IV fimbrial biogenesis protein FimT
MSRNTIPSKPARGFSIVELVVTLAVAAVLLAAAIPSFQSVIRSNRMSSQANELVTAFTLARSEAVKRNGTIAVCSADTSTSPPTCGTDWAEGTMVFADADGDGVHDTGEEIVRVFRAINPDDSITATPSTVNVVQFTGRGMTTLTGALQLQLEPGDCETDEQIRRDFTLDTNGRVRVAKAACS